MPIYDYLCASCRHLTEVIHGIHDAGPRFCPACGADGTMRKAMVSPAIHFKGSGWAKKDRSSSTAARTKAAASSSPGEGGSTAAGPGDAGGSAANDAPAAEPAKGTTGPAPANEA